jgi:hypothetical protein
MRVGVGIKYALRNEVVAAKGHQFDPQTIADT